MVWQRLPHLNGYTQLGRPKVGALVLAETPGDRRPLMVSQVYGKGRTMVLAVDTTWHWLRLGLPESTKGVDLHARFWKQLVIYLGKQENQGGAVWVKPDVRRLKLARAA